MKSYKSLLDKAIRSIRKLNRFRTLILALSAIVVFVVSYLLVLPALTLDEKEAEKQGGIDIVTQAPETDSQEKAGGDSSQSVSTEKDKKTEQTQKTPTYKDGELSYAGKSFDIEAAYKKDAKIPEGTELKVEEIVKKDDQYQEYYKKALDTVQKDDDQKASRLASVRFYDISLIADGTEIEPSDSVNVKISYEDGLPVQRAEQVRVLHFTEDEKDGEVKAEVLKDENVEAKVSEEKLSEASFDADSFSVYAVVTLADVGQLDGKTYGILNTQDGKKPQGIAVTSTARDSNKGLVGKETTVRVDPVTREDKVYVANNSNITMWTFTSAGDGKYYVSTTVGSAPKYLRISSGGISLVDGFEDEDCKITVTLGTGSNAGKYKFSTANGSLHLNGTNYERKAANATDSGVWMTFAELSNLNDDDFVVYTASKVSIAEDAAEVKNGDEVIIYTRIWNEDDLKYDYYAIDYDGKLVQAYESGDTISWVGSKVNTMLWDFTEYYYEGTNTPNYYYELQNTYSDKYIAPQVSGDGFLSDNTIGINLNGRRYNEYYSSVLAWDDPYYDYASLMVRNFQLISAPMSKADDFYFAKMTVNDPQTEDKLEEVKTVDHTSYGITIKMQDFGDGTTTGNDYRSREMDKIVGSSKYEQWTGIKNLMSKNLTDNDYPKANQTGYTLGDLFTHPMEVNHQFISTTHKETGYFEYDSTQNFAHLIWRDDDPWIGKTRPDGDTYAIGDFVVYDQLGTTDEGNKDTLKHGQFLPYNDLTEGQISTKYKNEMDIHANPLSSLDPRKGEELYNIPYQRNGAIPTYADHFFGMEMSASFMQSASGLDAWGHDLIFEFSGDDDFWLYIDGKLVLDLGGVHSALDGSVNFRTGKVIVNGTETNLRALYKEAYKEEHPDASNDEINDWLNSIFKDDGSNTGTVFKDYSGHTMRMFYLERGAGASNLHMRFNLAPYKDGEVLLEKQVTGTDKVDMTFPFQIWYEKQMPTGYEPALWGAGEGEAQKVTDYLTGAAVRYEPSYTIDGLTYQHVYFLEPGQTVAIALPDEETQYYIKECGMDTHTFDEVKVNGETVSGTSTDVDGREDYFTTETTVAARKKVIYENHVSPKALKSLTVTKRLWQDNGKTTEIHSGNGAGADNTEFRFRIYIGKEGNNYTVYNTGKYYVKDPEGHYCIYENGGFVSTGKTNFNDLGTTVPEGEWKSEQEKATFYSSPGGAVDKIKAGYSIEIPGLMAGTAYMIEERDYEIPAGYNLLGYTLTDGAYSSANTGTATNTGVINGSKNNETVSVHNQHGYGLTVNKNWSDAPFMTSHDPIYFAVYLKGSNEPLDGSVRQMADPVTSVRWFFPELAADKTLNDYEVYEVVLTGDITVDSNTGVVSGYTAITRKEQDQTIEVGGVENEHGYSVTHVYTVDYDREVLTDEQIENKVNSRTDTVTNARPGIKLIKTDMDGKTLPNARFVLTDGAGKTKTFISDANGLIVVAYLEANVEYTLQETAAPSGYRSLIDTITIKQTTDNTIYVNGVSTDPENGYYTITQEAQPTATNMPTVTIRNKDFNLRAVKIDSYSELPMKDVKFALYKEVKEAGTGNPMPDYAPMEGYAELVTNAEGEIPKIVLRNSENPDGLRPGTYYLRETDVSSAYRGIDVDIRIMISETGEITLGSARRPAQSGSWIMGDISSDIAVIEEEGSGGMKITVKNTPKDPIRIKKMEMGTEDKVLQGIKFELYRVSQIGEDGKPKEGEEPIIPAGQTDEHGILNLSGLEDGIYCLVETETLPGYNLLDAPVMITSTNGMITASLKGDPLNCKKVKDSDNRDVWEITVYNSTGVELPHTGGTGTTLIYLFGLILTVGAGALFIFKRKRGIY